MKTLGSRENLRPQRIIRIRHNRSTSERILRSHLSETTPTAGGRTDRISTRLYLSLEEFNYGQTDTDNYHESIPGLIDDASWIIGEKRPNHRAKSNIEGYVRHTDRLSRKIQLLPKESQWEETVIQRKEDSIGNLQKHRPFRSSLVCSRACTRMGDIEIYGKWTQRKLARPIRRSERERLTRRREYRFIPRNI